MTRKSLLTEEEICSLYLADERIQEIAEAAGVTRQAVRDTLIRCGVYDARKGTVVLVCRFCEERYSTWRSRVKRAGEGFGYCSSQCFHAARSLNGEYSANGGVMTRLMKSVGKVTNRTQGRRARKILAESGIELKPGEVVHHIDGDRQNNSIDNLRIFPSHAEHMMFHHSLRAGK